MDLQLQAKIKELVEKYGTEDLMVIIGNAEAEGAGITAETLTVGDPTYAGPLAGTALHLPVFSIFEEEIKQQIDREVYEQHIALIEMALDSAKIAEEVRRYRES